MHWEYGTCKINLSLRRSVRNYEFEMCLNVFKNTEHVFENDVHMFESGFHVFKKRTQVYVYLCVSNVQSSQTCISDR